MTKGVEVEVDPGIPCRDYEQKPTRGVMKVIYEFDDDYDSDDRGRRRIFERGEDFYTLLSEIDSECRSKIKYDENVSEQTIEFAEMIRGLIYGSTYTEME